MTTDTTFNGYSNYNTWNVALYLDNEYSYYQHMQTVIRLPAYRHDAKRLGKYIASWAKRVAKYNGSFGDLRPYRLRGVNWLEIAEGYIQELDLEAHQVTESGTYRSIWLNDSDFDYQCDNFEDTNTYNTTQQRAYEIWDWEYPRIWSWTAPDGTQFRLG